MFELEKAFDTLQLVAQGSKQIAEKIEKAEGQLHAVKRLVRPTDGGKPYYRTYWVADYNQAGEARHAIHSIDKVKKELEEKRVSMEKRPEDDWYKRQHDDTKATHDRLAARIAALEAPGGAVKVEDKIPTKKPGVAGFQVKEERMSAIDAEISQVNEQWKEWDKNGPDKIRKQTVADYKQAWKDAGLDIDENSRHFNLAVKDSEGKELMTIGHDMSWGGRDKRKPEFEMRMRHSSFKTSDPADFAKFAELTEAMSKVKSVTDNPAMMEKLGKLRSDYEDADMQGNYTNEFSDKIEALRKERRTLEEQVKAEKMVEALQEIGSDSFEMKDPYRFGEGRRSSSYRYAKITKQTPKQVVVAFSDTAAEGSFYQTKTFPTEQFEKFAKEHIDLDAHLPDYSGEVKGVKVETEEHKDTAKKLGVAPEKLGEMVNNDHKKEVAAEKPTLEKLRGAGADTLSKNKAGNYVARKSFFYTHGQTAEGFADKIKAVYPNAEIVDKGSQWKAFKGGASVAQGSHFWVEFKMGPAAAPVKTEEPGMAAALMSGWDKKDVVAYRDKMAAKIKDYKDEQGRGNKLSDEQKKDMNLAVKRLGEANTELSNRQNRNDAPAPEKHTMDPENNKKVTNYETYNHPSGGKINKGDKVTFNHNGTMKEGTVSVVNVYQRFANPYVKMKGTDGKTYEIVISKVNPAK